MNGQSLTERHALHRFARRAGVSVTAMVLAATAPGAQQVTASVPVTLSGEIRARSEWDRPGGTLAEDVFTYLRTRLGVRAAPADNLHLYFQLQDSRVYGASAGAATGNPNVTDLHQAYFDIVADWKARKVTTRVGRQEVAFGNERLIGQVGWSNTGRTFDAARVLLAPAGEAAPWSATLFVATVDEAGRRFGAPASGTGNVSDRGVIGTWFNHTLQGGMLEATLLYDAGAKYRSYTESNRVTFDTRFKSRAAAALGFDAEVAWQGGSQRYTPSTGGSVGQDVSAWMLAGRFGRMAAPGRKTSVIIGADILSGDARQTDGEYNAFNTMYATNHQYYGFMDLFSDPAARTNDAGLADLFGSVSHQLTDRTTLRMDLHRFATQAGGAGEIGWEFDVIAPIKLTGGSALELGYTTFRASDAAPAISLGTANHVRHWGYLHLRAGF